MSVDDFQGSFAQKNISFSVTETVTTVPGANFKNVMIFLGTLDSTVNFVSTPPVAGTATAFSSTNYAGVVNGELLAWMTQFFEQNTLSTVYVVIYTETATIPIDGPTQLAIDAVYQQYKDLAYWKFMLHTDISAQVQLAKSCTPDAMLSRACVGTSDAQMVVPDSTTSWAYSITSAGYDAWMIYHVDTNYNPVLIQLGMTLGVLNATGTSITNPVQLNSTLNITPSGTTHGSATLTNLSSVQYGALQTINCPYWETVGDGSDSSCVIGGTTLKGFNVSATWFEAYVNMVSSQEVATFLTTLGAPTWKNNATIGGIIGIVKSNLTPFANIGAISNLYVKPYTLATIPPSSGNNVTLPNLWTANWNKSVSSVIVQGQLTFVA